MRDLKEMEDRLFAEVIPVVHGVVSNAEDALLEPISRHALDLAAQVVERANAVDPDRLVWDIASQLIKGLSAINLVIKLSHTLV